MSGVDGKNDGGGRCVIYWSEGWGCKECSFESFLHRDLLGSEDERCFFLCERRQGVCEMSEVLNENSDYADSAKEGSYFGEVFAQAPVDDFVDPRRVGDAAIRGANVPYNCNFSRAQ